MFRRHRSWNFTKKSCNSFKHRLQSLRHQIPSTTHPDFNQNEIHARLTFFSVFHWKISSSPVGFLIAYDFVSFLSDQRNPETQFAKPSSSLSASLSMFLISHLEKNENESTRFARESLYI